LAFTGGNLNLENLQFLLDRNREWADSTTAEDPEFFSALCKQQAPQYLWIGCSDSRVPANQIVSLPPGEVFVHRNIANVVVHTDLNCLSVIQYAVEALQVKHIIVCGHYGCGGISAAMEEKEHGLIDNWLRHIKDVGRFNAKRLDGLADADRFRLMCELNVIEQVKNVCTTTIVKGAWRRGAELSVHGWIYDIGNGILKDLDACISSIAELEGKYQRL